ncbi:MAG TPA: helix-hairpin-helix domain-containing protein [Chitinophagales bacterium]|nr:helix-hairpin-helix domain-containing protein [Chitinophagales bacterium]
MRKWLDQLFTFTRGERNGIVVLVFLCLFAFVFRYAYFYFKPVEHFNNSEHDKEVNEFLAEYNSKNGQPEPQEQHVSTDTAHEVGYRKSDSEPYTAKPRNATSLKLDINTADAEEFEKLRGIGPVISKRIVKFRILLGGFAAVEQLKEVYGLPDSTYRHIKTQLVVGSQAPTHININTASYKEFKAHPYFRDNAKLIEAHRKQHGDFKQVSDLKNVDGVTDSTYRKMAPYATVE